MHHAESSCVHPHSIGGGPLLSFLRALPATQKIKRWLVRALSGTKSNYEPSTSLARFLTSTLLLVELPLVLGFCYPILFPLAWFALMINAGVFLVAVKYLGMAFKDTVTVSFHYLWISLAVGSAIPIWLWQEGNLSGKWLISFGAPCAAALVVGRKIGRGDDTVILSACSHPKLWSSGVHTLFEHQPMTKDVCRLD